MIIEFTVVDIDECKNYKCGGRCINLPGTYQCECDKGYRLEDDRCVDVDECLSNPCQGRCINLIGSFRCECGEGYTTERHLCIGIRLVSFSSYVEILCSISSFIHSITFVTRLTVAENDL